MSHQMDKDLINARAWEGGGGRLGNFLVAFIVRILKFFHSVAVSFFLQTNFDAKSSYPW